MKRDDTGKRNRADSGPGAHGQRRCLGGYHKGLCGVELGIPRQGMDRLTKKPDEWGPGGVDTESGGSLDGMTGRCWCPEAPQL